VKTIIFSEPSKRQAFIGLNDSPVYNAIFKYESNQPTTRRV